MPEHSPASLPSERDLEGGTCDKVVEVVNIRPLPNTQNQVPKRSDHIQPSTQHLEVPEQSDHIPKQIHKSNNKIVIDRIPQSDPIKFQHVALYLAPNTRNLVPERSSNLHKLLQYNPTITKYPNVID